MINKATAISVSFFVCLFCFSFSDRTHYSNNASPTPYDLQLPYYFDIPAIPENNPLTNEGVALGRMLFYDPILSIDSNYSCSNCHKQKFGFTDGLNVSLGYMGKPVTKNSMTLINLAWQEKFFWDGRKSSLEQQVLDPIFDSIELGNNLTMLLKRFNENKQYRKLFKETFQAETIDTVLIAKVLAQFLRSLVSTTTEMDELFGNFREMNVAGSVNNNSDHTIMTNLFVEGIGKNERPKKNINDYQLTPKTIDALMTCIKCHDKSFFGGNTIMANDGLDKNSKELFKTPTFRNLAFTAPYMHDGRFKDIFQVIRFYNSNIQPSETLSDLLKDKDGKPKRFFLSEEEIISLGNFLLSIKDSAFLTNESFSNPFK
jgi:cytochrome c peroxidase